ncbi:MAG: AI-2E family transporter, partial [Elusimicrobia bacterium]|nr:AI-2E family transporter [Elusimicrobiota bacterium]
MTRSQKVSYGLFGGVIVGIVAMHLGGPLLAGLFSYMILDYANQKLSRRMAKTLSRWFSLLIFLVIATGVVWLLVYFLRQTISTIPQIVTDATPAVIEIAQRHNVSLPFDSIQELREVIIGAIKGHAGEITKVSGLLSKRIFHILAGMFVAVLCFFADRDESYQANLFDAIRKDFNRRARGLMEGFEKVIGAQVIISLINTTATAIFLVVTGFPYIHFLVPATFIVGILPIIGNLISNTFIVATALTISPKLALAALVF